MTLRTLVMDVSDKPVSILRVRNLRLCGHMSLILAQSSRVPAWCSVGIMSFK